MSMMRYGVGLLMLAVFVCQGSGANLIAHYDFDDASNLGSDITGNGHDLAAFDIAPEYSYSGKLNGAANFDGATQGYQVQNYIFPEGDFSVSVWVKPDILTPLILAAHGSSSGFAISQVSSEFRFWTYHTSGVGDSWVGSGVAPVMGQWQHLAMTFEATSGPDSETGNYIGVLKVYVNGVLANTKTDAEYDAESWNDLDIGHRTSYYYSGSIDDLRVYEGVLSGAEISGMMPAEIIASYSFDDPNGLGYDDSGNGYDLSVYDEATSAADYIKGGVLDGAACFNGESQGYRSPSGIFPEGAFSFVAWVKPDSISPTVVRSYSSSGGFAVSMASTEFRFWTFYDSGNYDCWLGSGIVPSLGQWQHIAMTFEPTSGPDATTGNYVGTLKAYINGVLANTKIDAEYDSETWIDMTVGRYGGSSYFDGCLDDVHIFKGVLTADEINEYVVDLPLRAIAYYSFDDPNGLDGIACDDTGNGHVLADYGVAPEHTELGRIAGAADFDGSTNGFVAENYIFPDGEFTVSLWAKPEVSQSTSLLNAWGSSSGFGLSMVTSEFRFWTYYDSGQYDCWIGNGIAPAIGQWQHLAMTFEPTSGPDENGNYIGTLKVYVNGLQANIRTDAIYDAESWNDLAIGRYSSSYYNGLIDELAIFDVALSEEQIYGLVTGQFDPLNVGQSSDKSDLNDDGITDMLDFAELAGSWLMSSYR